MKRYFVNLAALLLGLVLGGVATYASAETINATYTANTGGTRYNPNTTPSANFYSDPLAACLSYWSNSVSVVADGAYGFRCKDASNLQVGYVTATFGCFDANSHLSVACTGGTYSCPENQNWTLSGTTCTRPDCVAPQVRESDGTCSAPPCAAGSTSTASRYVGTFATGSATSVYGVATPIPATLCDGSCFGVPTSAISCTAGSAMQGQPVECTYNITLNGSTCSGGNGTAPVDPTLTAPNPPCSSGQGAISNQAGKVVCVNQGADFQGATYPPKENKTTSTTTNPDGSTKTVTNIQTCTGEGACSTSTTTTIGAATGGGAGMAGTPGTTTTSTDKPKSETSDFCAQFPNLQICKGGMNEEATQKEVRDELKKLTTPNVTDDAAITGATHSAASQTALEAENLKVEQAATGVVDPTSSHKSSWLSAMESGWFAGIPQSSCSPFVSNYSGKTWTFDVCPTAAKISEWGAWAFAFMAAFMIWGMVTQQKET